MHRQARSDYTDRQAGRQAGSSRLRQTDGQPGRQTDKHITRWTDKLGRQYAMDMDMERQTGR